MLSPAATEIEAQTVRWIAELIGYPDAAGGLLVSGGNMANIVVLLRRARREGAVERAREGAAWRRRPAAARLRLGRDAHLDPEGGRPLGLGTDAMRWIPTDADLRMDVAALRAAIDADRAAGDVPFLVVGTAGSVSTGAVDPLPGDRRALPRGGPLVPRRRRVRRVRGRACPRRPPTCAALRQADSVAVDPHKWLYAPLEAGCALVRDPATLRDAFSYHPPYYHFDEQATELRRLRAAELARLPRAQGLARAAAGRRAPATGA